MAVVYNILQTPGGTPLENHTVTIDLLTSGNPFTISDSEVVFRTTAVTDSTGQWEKELPPQSAYEQINTRYVVEQGDKPGHKWYFEVPNEGTYWLRDLIDVEFPGPYPEQAPVEPHRLAAHSDVNTDGAVDDDGLTYDAATGFWTPGHPTPAAHTHPQAEVNGLQDRFGVIEGTLDDATPAPTPLTLVERDTAGRAQVTDPTVAADIATKSYADLMIPLTQRAAADGVATLDPNAVIPNAQLPALAISDTFVAATESAMVELPAQVGDIAVRTDLSRSFILAASPANTLANWQELLTPEDAVTSVNGRVGVVSLAAGDVDALATGSRGVANGVASLDTSGTIPQTQLPPASAAYFGQWTDDGGGRGTTVTNGTAGGGSGVKVTDINVPTGNAPAGCSMTAGTFTPDYAGKWHFVISTQYEGSNTAIRALYLAISTAANSPTGVKYGLLGGPTMDAQTTGATIALDAGQSVSVYVAVWTANATVYLYKSLGNTLTATWLGP